MTRCYGIDVGNSRVKIRALPDCAPPAAGATAAIISAASLNSEEVGSEDETESLPENASIEMVAVQPERAAALIARLEDRGSQVRLWKAADLPIANPYADPGTLGADRPLAALAAGYLVGAPAIVIDAGTALTVDLLDASGAFAGGAIAPGFRTLARSLGAAGAMLSVVDGASVEYPGRSTRAALELGVTAAFVGAARQLIAMARVREPRAALVVCGGDADLLVELLGEEGALRAPLLTIGLWLLSRRPRT